MHRAEAFALLERSRVARLATVRPDNSPHVVPITFALVDGAIVTTIDHKPKTTMRLQRLANIEFEPRVAVLVDEWFEDWDRLSWARFDGVAEIHREGTAWVEAREALADRYDQYRGQLPEGPAIVITIDKVTCWASTR